MMKATLIKQLQERKVEQVINIELSIIVPVYNVEKYLEECLDSILIKNKEYKLRSVNNK